MVFKGEYKVKKEENVFIPGLKLFIICFFVALGLSSLNFLTEPIITEANEQKKHSAMKAVLENCDFYQINENVYEGKKDGKLEGYAVSVVSPIGYGGDIELIVGFDKDIKITGVSFVQMAETKDIGTKTRDEAWFTEQFIGNSVPAEDEFEAVTGATVSSRAVRYGLELAEKEVKEAIGK